MDYICDTNSDELLVLIPQSRIVLLKNGVPALESIWCGVLTPNVERMAFFCDSASMKLNTPAQVY